MNVPQQNISLPPPSGSAPRPVFVAFEGGGAKGIVHVGALKALEERKFKMLGLAGTSAGAIIASLVAAGYSSNEIINQENGSHILSLLPMKKTTFISRLKSGQKERGHGIKDLFGAGGWFKIKLLEYIFKTASASITTKIALSSILFLPGLVAVLYLCGLHDFAAHLGMILFLITAVMIVTVIAAAIGLSRGLNDLDVFIKNLNHLLSLKLYPNSPETQVLMGDFGRNGRPTLKIVASDIQNSCLKLFSSSDPKDAHTPVAQAVAASICLPIIFRPLKLGGNTYMDGGLVSNLPIWPFDTERALDPNAITIAVQIVQSHDKAAVKNGDVSIKTVLETALFGASILNLRAVSDLVTVRLPTTLSTLSFDASFASFCREIEAAQQFARAQLSKQVDQLPKLCREAGNKSIRYVTNMLSTGVILNHPGNPTKIRVSIAVDEDNNRSSLRIKHCVGYENDFDEGILLPINESVVGHVWQTKKALFVKYPLPPELDLAASRSNATRKRVSKDLKWFFAIPVFSSPVAGCSSAQRQIKFVIAIDGTDELRPGLDLNVICDTLSPKVTAFYEPVLSLMEVIENAQAKSAPWM